MTSGAKSRAFFGMHDSRQRLAKLASRRRDISDFAIHITLGAAVWLLLL